MHSVYSQIRSLAREREAETVRFLCDLIRTPSFSGKEKNVIKRIAEEMQRTGFDRVQTDGLGSIIGTIGNGPRSIALDAHVDTVLEGDRSQWDSDPFEPRVKDGRVWGRGSVDQKGGLASMICAAGIIRELGFNSLFTLHFTGTVMEEDCDGLCWQHLIGEEQLRPELVVITEPTDMNLYRGQRGRMEIRLEVKGRSCHGSAPERGDNAIYKTARIALEIEKLNERLPSDPFLGKGSVTVTEVRSSSPSLCAVPDGSNLHLDRRLTHGETAESAVAEVRDAASRAGYPDAEVRVLTYEEPAYTGKVFPTPKYYPTWVLPEDSEYLRSAAEAYVCVLGRQPQIGKWTFSTNGGAIAGMHGIPCFGLGPGNEVLAHAPNEACPVDQLVEAAAFYAALIARLHGM
jgi:putative selenium metabolism hydrolase